MNEIHRALIGPDCRTHYNSECAFFQLEERAETYVKNKNKTGFIGRIWKAIRTLNKPAYSD